MEPNLCKMFRKGICEVALRQKNDSGTYVDIPTDIVDRNDRIRKSIINIGGYGTGFVVRKIRNSLFVRNLMMYAVAIVATAAHVVVNPILYAFDRDCIQCSFPGSVKEY